MKTTLILLIDRLLHLTEGDLKRSCMSLRLISFLILLVTMPILSMAEPNKHRDGECGHESYSDNYYVLSWDNGSDSFYNEGSNNLFDSNSNTKWCSSYPLDGNAETYVIFHFGGNVRLVSYTLTTANDTQGYPGRNWTAWTIYGGNSIDGTWTQVDKKVGQTLPSENYTVSDLFEVDGTNTTAYQYYKIVIDAIGDADVQQMADINFNVACSEGHVHGTEENPHVDKNNDEYCDLCGIFIISPAPQVDGVYQISNAGNLYWFAALVNGDKTIIGEDVSQNSSANAKLMNDIVVNENVLVDGALNTDAATVNKFLTWTPMGYYNSQEDNLPYSGTFDGDNHTISGLYFDNGGANKVGLFGYLANGSVKNLGVIDSYFNAGEFVGAIVGYITNLTPSNPGAISNCYNTGVCKGYGYVGGIVGGNVSSVTKIINCYNTGTITGINNIEGYAGGILGIYTYTNGEVSNCYNIGSVSGRLPGGIISYGDATISNCYYLEGTAPKGIGDIDQNHENQPDSKTNTQFASGEVAYLLQGSQDIQVWGQNIDNEEGLQNKQDNPVLSDARVYKIVEDEEPRYSNFMGGSVVWSYEDGVLTIHGSGSMLDFESNETKPWEQYLSDINTVIVKEEITGIGTNAFSDITNTTTFFFYNSEIISFVEGCIKSGSTVYVPATWDVESVAGVSVTKMPTYTLTGWSKSPDANSHVVINSALVLGQQSTSSKTTDNNNVLTVSSFGLTENGSITIKADELIVDNNIVPGGQLICEQANGEVTVERTIEGYNPEPRAKSEEPRAKSQGSTKWYTISSPLKGNVNATDITNLISETPKNYDLYRYDEPSYTWQNSKTGENSTGFQNIEPGRGYLYANKNGVKLSFEGEINTESVEYTLTASDNTLSGFHLVGNPFTHNITFDKLSVPTGVELAAGYYVLSNQGAWAADPSTGDIKPGQGILIKTDDACTLTISPNATTNVGKGQEPRAKSQQPMLSLNVSNGNYSDGAFVIFGEGVGLDKINHENKDIPLLYIPMSDADYAIAMMDESVSEIPVNFETNSMGEFTISLRQENCVFEELYLLDKETGAKVNILEQDYTFMAMSGDNPDRFILVKSQGSQPEAQSNFAYINNNDIVIYDVEGNAHIDIYDVLGRRVYNNNASYDVHIVSTDGYSAGVYVIRLMDEKGLRTQKVVVE